jgi:DNA-binding Lrp family transcriptional regulator
MIEIRAAFLKSPLVSLASGSIVVPMKQPQQGDGGMVTAIVLVNVERIRLKTVVDDILAIDGVTEVYMVAGEYDLVAIVRVADNASLSRIVCDVMPHQISGITHTKTLFALEAKSPYDLSALFKV